MLDEKFNLNTQRIVNFRVNQGKTVYLYSSDGKYLYYCASSLQGIKGDLGIHHETCVNCIKTGNSYLDYFLISNSPLDTAEKTKLSLEELLELIDSKKKEVLKIRTRAKFSKAIIIRKEGQ